jgi:hypothetical protein
MTMPGRNVTVSPLKIRGVRGVMPPLARTGRGVPLARFLQSSFLNRGGRLLLPPRQDRRPGPLFYRRLISGLASTHRCELLASGGRGQVEPPPSNPPLKIRGARGVMKRGVMP